jgi:hypothetical protein
MIRVISFQVLDMIESTGLQQGITGGLCNMGLPTLFTHSTFLRPTLSQVLL